MQTGFEAFGIGDRSVLHVKLDHFRFDAEALQVQMCQYRGDRFFPPPRSVEYCKVIPMDPKDVPLGGVC